MILLLTFHFFSLLKHQLLFCWQISKDEFIPALIYLFILWTVHTDFVPGALLASVASTRNNLLAPALQKLKAKKEHRHAHKSQDREINRNEYMKELCDVDSPRVNSIILQTVLRKIWDTLWGYRVGERTVKPDENILELRHLTQYSFCHMGSLST